MTEERFIVTTTIRWPNGHLTRRIIDWNNDYETKNFAQVERAAIWKGASVTSERLRDIDWRNSDVNGF